MSKRLSRARVLYLWEWGAGYGHIRRFRPLAESLRRSSCDVVLVVKEPQRAREVFPESEIAILQCPEVDSPSVPRYQDPHSFAGLAWNLGVNAAAPVAACVERWRNLLVAVNPTHVIADFGLLGAYVANALGFPTTRIGTGFGTPPQNCVLPRSGW